MERTWLQDRELTDEDKRKIAENMAIHRDARDYATKNDVFVVCSGLIYAPSGVAVAYCFTYDPLHGPGIQELMHRAGGCIWPGGISARVSATPPR